MGDATAVDHPKPTVGRIVHYVAHVPDGAPVERAAMVLEVDEEKPHVIASLRVFTPHGDFNASNVEPAPPNGQVDTWHWPERV